MVDLDIRECVFCDKLFTMPMGGVSSSYGNVCTQCKTRALEDTDHTHELVPDPYNDGAAFDEGWQELEKAPYHGTTVGRAKKILEEGGKPMDPGGAIMGDPRFYMTRDELDARAYAVSRSIGSKDDPPALLYIDDDHIDDRVDVEDLGWNNLSVGHVLPKFISMVDDSEEELASKEINEQNVNDAGWFIHRNKNQGRSSDKRIWEQKPPEGFNKAFALLKRKPFDPNDPSSWDDDDWEKNTEGIGGARGGNHPDFPVDKYDWEEHHEEGYSEYGPDVDRNVLNVPGMQEMLQDLQNFSGSCLDEMDERVFVALGLIERGWSKTPMRGMPE